MTRASPRLVMSKRTGKYPGAVRMAQSLSIVILSDSTSSERNSPASLASGARKTSAAKASHRISARIERLRKPALDLWHRREERVDDAPAVPAFEPRGVVEHEPVRHRGPGHAPHVVETDVGLAGGERARPRGGAD